MNAVAKINYTHDALIDQIIANPAMTQGQLAALFGYTQGWVSRVMSSDAFKTRLEARRKELVDPTIAIAVEERLDGVIGQALENLAASLEADKSPTLALKALEVSTRARGYGARAETQVNVQNNFVVALPQKSETVQQWQAEHRPTPPISVIDLDTVIDVPNTV